MQWVKYFIIAFHMSSSKHIMPLEKFAMFLFFAVLVSVETYSLSHGRVLTRPEQPWGESDGY